MTTIFQLIETGLLIDIDYSKRWNRTSIVTELYDLFGNDLEELDTEYFKNNWINPDCFIKLESIYTLKIVK